MTKIKFISRGLWQSYNASQLKGDPKKLRMRAEELKLKSAALANEADELFALAEQIEAARKRNSRKMAAS